MAVKIALFSYAAINIPSMKFMPDTPTYIEPGINLVEKGVFATFDDNGKIQYVIHRTPGYPIFIGLLRKIFKLSFDYIVVVQILLITLAGYIIYKAAFDLDRNIALLAAFIFLFDLPVTLSALMLLTEALYTVFIALFIFFFLKYLKGHKIGLLVLSILMLVIATYIRPISYYLGICLAGGVIYFFYRIDIKKAIAHALIILMIFYSFLGLWHYRNYVRTGDGNFTVVDDEGLYRIGLLRKYAKEDDPENVKTGPFLYYTGRTVSSFIQFFTLPGTLKYFRSQPIKMASKIYGYLWMVFWLIGIFFARYDKLPFRFLLLIVLYFAMVSIVVVGLAVGSRFRAPVMPLLSILSANGWMRIFSITRQRFKN